MYEYRKLTAERKAETVRQRRLNGFPPHSPPHVRAPGKFRLITGACFEHRRLLSSSSRLDWFQSRLLDHLGEHAAECTAWVVLPNHYHALVKIEDIKAFAVAQGQLHGRSSLELNQMDNAQGRTCWYGCGDRYMRGQRHYHVTLNYIHNNPVKHGYVARWSEWRHSSFHWYLETKGREWLEDVWREYPLLDYGQKWDQF